MSHTFTTVQLLTFSMSITTILFVSLVVLQRSLVLTLLLIVVMGLMVLLFMVYGHSIRRIRARRQTESFYRPGAHDAVHDGDSDFDAKSEREIDMIVKDYGHVKLDKRKVQALRKKICNNNESDEDGYAKIA